MNELERLKQRVGLSQPTNLYSDRRLGTYQAYDDEEKKKQREIAETKAKIETLKEIENRDIPKQQMSIKSASDWGVNKYSKEFSQQLASDIEQTRAYGKGAGLSDKDIEDRLIPKTDGNSVKTRLSEIENKIKPGRENIAYQVQEGWMEKEVMNILSEEAVKEMNGLPNSRAEVDAFIASHPELQINEDANLVDKGIRFIGDLSRMSRDSAEYAVKDKESWLVAGAVLLGGTALTVATGGAALPIFATTLGASLATLTPLAAAGLGMSYGGLKKMAELETGLAYNEYLNEGVHPEIAKNIASTVGAINGVLEMAEIGTILTGVPGANVVAGKAMDMAKSELQKKAIRAVAAYGVNLASNALEEMAQESNTMLGLELSKYLQDAPNPNTMDGLRVLANTMTTEEYRDRVVESGLQAIQSMWLVPIGTSVARTGIRSAVADMEAKAQQKAAKGWYDEKDRQTNEYINKQKEIILSDDGAIDTLAGKVTNDRDATSYATLISMEPFLDDLINRKDLTNEEREILIQKSNILKEALASVQFDAKSENNNINLKPTSMEEVIEIVLNGQAEHSNIENGTYIDRYKEARELNLIDKVKTMRAEGKTTSEIADAIQKLLPKKRRNAVEANLILSSIEKVEQAAKQQRNLNLVSNFEAIKPTLNRNEPSDSPTTNETNAGDTNTQPQAENANMDSVVPENGIEVEEPTQTMANEVKTETIEHSTLKKDIKPSEEVRQKYESADVVKVPVSEINIDPQRFQFRFEGTTDKLVGAKWNDNAAGTVLLWENEYGDLYVVNGHHRVQLAKDNNVETLDAKILKGVTAEEARAEGAFRNIAEGSATSIDVAKYMRDTGTTLKDMQEYGIAPKSKIARDGEALSNLDDFIFKAVATRQFPVEKGIIIGREFGKDKAAQRGFLVALQKQEAKGKNITNDVMQEMIAQEKGMAQETFTEQTMFGTVEDRKSLTVERAELVAYTKGQLKSRVSLLKNVSKEKNAKILESLGNKVDKDVNFREMEVADQALELLNITLNQQGTIANRMFNEFAREYAQADNKEAVKKKALNAFIEAMESGVILEEAFGKKTASEAIVEAITEELEGQGDLFGQFAQIKEMPNIKVTAKHGTDQATYDKLIPLIELMEKNPMFNGLEIVFTGQASTKVMTRSELDAKGYYNAKPGRYTTYGWYESRANSLSERDNAERTDQGDSARDQLRNNRNTSQKSRGRISLNNSAQVDTLLHEAIHSIQDILYRVDPEFEVLVKDWEEQVQDLAREQGIALPQGREMLTHALMLGEFGYANDDFNLAKAVEVPAEIVRQFKAMLGKDFIKETMGNVKADADRAIKAEFKKLADINLTDAELAKSIARAKERRLNKIKMDLRAGETIKYYSPDSTTYAIAVPKDTNYEVSFFNEQGLLTKAVMEINKLAKKLSDMKLYYNPGEISYQLKQFDRTQIDEVVTGNDLKDISNIVRAFENARVGNFTASDYDNYAKGKLSEADGQDLLKAIMNAAEKGLDKPNSEVTIQEYVNRFYPQKMESNDYGMRERDGKIEFFYKAYDEMSPYRSDEIVPIKVLGTFDSVTEAIKAYRDWTYLNRDLSTYKDKAFNKQFYYMPDYWDQLVQEYEDFKANYETYRHDYSTDFDGQPKFNVSYQIKKGLSDTKRINPEAGEILTVVYKGFKDGEAKRIKTGNSQWDSFFFVADNPLDASLYGNTLEEYSVSPKAKILYEGTKEFSAISKHKKNETMLEWSSRIANIAKEQGYDAVWFKRQGEIGTAIINRDILDLPSERINYQVKQVADINTEEFRTFFGESKVVDQEGNPLIVYHGSYKNFSRFNLSKTGWNTNNQGLYGRGFYFTDRLEYAKSYGDNLYESYVSIQKPFVISGEDATIEQANLVYAMLQSEGIPTYEEFKANNQYMDKPIHYIRNSVIKNAEKFRKALMKNGYDGVIFDNSTSTVDAHYMPNSRFSEIVVFKPTQIKSIYNNGQFSLYDPNINYQLKADYRDEVTGFYSGQTNMLMTAVDGDEQIGYIDYSIYDNEIYINLIEVPESKRRQGIAKSMLQRLQRENPDMPINWGGTTEDGTALYNAITYQVEDKQVSEQLLKLQSMKQELQEMETRFENGTDTVEDGNNWGILYDSIRSLEKELEGKSQYRTFIKEDSGTQENLNISTTNNNPIQYELGRINNFVEASGNTSVAYGETVDALSNRIMTVSGEVPSRLMPFIKYDAVMGGYDAIAINGEEPVMITRDEILEIMSKRQPLFQLKGELMAVHNIGEGQLLSAMKLGGLPMASIAITKTDYNHDRYGEISLLFNKNTIDPRLNKANRVYSGDAYTPTFPSIRYKINENAAYKLRDRVKAALVGTEYMNAFRDTIDPTNIEDQVNRSGGFDSAYKYDPLLMLTYLKEKGIDFEPVTKDKRYEFDIALMEQLQAIEGELINKKYLDKSDVEQLDAIFRETINKFYGVDLYREEIGYGKMDRLHSNVREFANDTSRQTIDNYATETKLKETIDEADYSQWLNEVSESIIESEGIRNSRDLFTNSGTRRGWNALHDPVTLDNILRAMTSESETASGMFGGIGRFWAAVSRVYKSIAEIKKDASRLTTMDEETYLAMRNEYQERLINLASRIKGSNSNSFMAIDHAFEAMIDALTHGKNRQGIANILNEYKQLNITEDAIDEMMQLADEVAQMPTEYFEAKPRRIIYFNEVQAAVIPVTASETLIQALRQNGIHVLETYDPNIEGDRQRAMNEVLGKNDVSFQIKPTPTDTEAFKKWFKDSKVVDENGNPLVLYHGTPYYGFTEFKKGLQYFSPIKQIADIYQSNSASMLRPGSNGNNPGTYEVYLSMKKPFDTREPEARRIFMEEYYRKYGSGSPLTDKGLVDWVEGEDLYDFLTEQGYDYDGILFDEGGMGGYGDDVINRGISYAVFSPTQIKSVYNTGAWSATNADIYYQIKGEPDLEERSWGQTVRDSGIVSEWLRDLLTDEKFMYEVAHNEDSIIEGAKLIQDRGIDYVEKFLDSDLEAGAVEMAAGMILMHYYDEAGDKVNAREMTSKVAAKATTMGQGIQILSTLAKETPLGMMRHFEKQFNDLATDAQRKNLQTLTDKVADEAKRINEEAIEKVDIEKSVNKVKDMTQEEMDVIQVSKSDQLTFDFIAGEEVKTQAKTDIDTKLIMQAIKEHYKKGGKGSLKSTLKKIGLNDLEADLISQYVKGQMKEATDAQMQQIIDGVIPGKAEAVDKSIKDLLSEGAYGEALKVAIGQKKGIPVFSQDMADMVMKRAKEIGALPRGRQRDVETAKLVRDVTENIPIGIGRKISTFQTMMMLLNAKTTIRNLLGNSMFRQLDTFTMNTIGAGVDKLVASSTGQRTTLTRLMDARKKQKEGYKQGWQYGKEDALLGISTTDNDTKFELKSGRTFSRGTPLGKMETVLNLALRATDRAAFTASYLDSLEEQMLIAGVVEPTQEMHDNAVMLGLYRTFNDDTVLSKLFSEAKRTLNIAGLPNREFGLGDLLMKFPRTPANIMMRSIDYSPVGAVQGMIALYKNHSSSDYVTQRMAVEKFSRGIMGSGIIGIGAFLATIGILTGSDPDEDKDKYELQTQAGLREFSVNLSAIPRVLMLEKNGGELRPGDKLASYDWAQPISMGIAVGADTVLGSGETLDMLSTVVRAAEAGVTTLTEQPLFTGIANMFRYGDPVQGLTQILKGMPATFTPSLLSQVAQAVDGGSTDPYSFYPIGRQAWNLIANRLPGSMEIGDTPLGRGAVPNRIGVLGNEQVFYQEDEGIVSRLAKSMLSPSILSEYMPSEEARFLIELFDATGDSDVIPNKPQKQYTLTRRNGEKVVIKPTPKEWEEWSRWLGENTRADISRALNYTKGWSPEEQADEIKYLIDRRRDELKEMIFMQQN